MLYGVGSVLLYITMRAFNLINEYHDSWTLNICNEYIVNYLLKGKASYELRPLLSTNQSDVGHFSFSFVLLYFTEESCYFFLLV